MSSSTSEALVTSVAPVEARRRSFVRALLPLLELRLHAPDLDHALVGVVGALAHHAAELELRMQVRIGHLGEERIALHGERRRRACPSATRRTVYLPGGTPGRRCRRPRGSSPGSR
jgi:hypothetical protein